MCVAFGADDGVACKCDDGPLLFMCLRRIKTKNKNAMVANRIVIVAWSCLPDRNGIHGMGNTSDTRKNCQLRKLFQKVPIVAYRRKPSLNHWYFVDRYCVGSLTNVVGSLGENLEADSNIIHIWWQPSSHGLVRGEELTRRVVNKSVRMYMNPNYVWLRPKPMVCCRFFVYWFFISTWLGTTKYVFVNRSQVPQTEKLTLVESRVARLLQWDLQKIWPTH